jgi:hypothetical protein
LRLQISTNLPCRQAGIKGCAAPFFFPINNILTTSGRATKYLKKNGNENVHPLSGSKPLSGFDNQR